MQLNKQYLRFLVLSRKKNYIEAFCWVTLFLLIVGFNAIHFWLHEIPLKSNPFNSVITILKFSFLYFAVSAVLVLFNLKVLNKILASQKHPIIAIGGYLIVAIIASLLFSILLNVMDKYIELWRFKSDLILNVVINFTLCLASTGLLKISDLKKDTKQLIRKLKQRKQTPAPALEMSVARTHIKIGTRCNFDLVNFDDIVYFMADGKSPIIYTTKGKYYGDFSIADYERRLPNKSFIRIHRKYIIAKSKVVKRAGNSFILSDGKNEKIVLKIGDSYLPAIENDPYLGFHPQAQLYSVN